jgi:hypothetical protein
MLANLKSLELSDCDSVKDVSCFQNIPHLNLNRCGITDVSSLGKCQNLNLSHCENIRDVSALKNVHTLDLSHCDQLTDLSALTGVYSLKFEGFKGTDLFGLEKVVLLDISESDHVSDVSLLQSVKQLNILNCKNVLRLSELRELKELTVSWKSQSLSDMMEVFPRLTQVDLFNDRSNRSTFGVDEEEEVEEGEEDDYFRKPDPLWSDGRFLSSLQNVKEIMFYDWNVLREFPYFDNLQSLHICGANNIAEFSLPAWPCLGRLEVSFCENLASLRLLGNSALKYPLYKLKIEECHELMMLRTDRPVFHCIVNICDGLEVIEVHQQIAHLKFNPVELKKITNQSKIVCLDLSLNDVKSIVDKDKDEMIFEHEPDSDFSDEEKEQENEEDEEEEDYSDD